MKARLLLIFLALCAAIIVPAAAQSTVTPEVTATPRGSYVTAPNIYVRGGPGENFIPVGSLLEGDRLFPVNVSADGNWILIRYNTGFGWIRRDLARWDDDVDALPMLDETDLTPTSLYTPAPTGLYTATPEAVFVEAGSAGARVRSGPAMRFPHLGGIVSGEQVAPVGRSADGNWILIRYREGFGWISRELLIGGLNVESLPVLLLDALTPSATSAFTATPSATSTDTPTATVTPSATPSPTETLMPTITPSATDTFTPTLLPTNTQVPSATSTLNPSATPTSTATETLTHTPTNTLTLTATPLPSETPTLTATASLTLTPTASDTPTLLPSSTATITPPPSATSTPTTAVVALVVTEPPTETVLPTETPTLSVTPRATNTDAPTVTPTRTQTPAPTDTDAPTVTPTRTQTPAPTDTDAPTDSHTPTEMPPTQTSTSPATGTAVPTQTAAPTDTSTPTRTAVTEVAALVMTPTAAETTPTITATSEAIILPGSLPTPVSALPETPASDDGTVRPEVIVGGAALVLLLGYVGLYWRGLMAVDRYSGGFVVDHCPVCGEGHLTVDMRQDRLLGIPRPRAVVSCDHCRSLLRQVGRGRWRYAVDRAANPLLHNQLNGKIVDEATLKQLARQSTPPAPVVRPPTRPPTFIDED